LADDTDSAHSVVREKQKPAGAGFEQIPEGILLDSCFSSILDCLQILQAVCGPCFIKTFKYSVLKLLFNVTPDVQCKGF
jgi:hypothetical protein